MKVTVHVTAFASGVRQCGRYLGRMRASGKGGEHSKGEEITMNFKMFLTVAVLVACALPSAARAGSLSTEVLGMFPQSAGEFAYADLRQARSLGWFPRLQEQILPERFRQFELFVASAGVDANSQVEELAWALFPARLPAGATQNIAVATSEEIVGIALGPFRPESAEAYFQAQKLAVVIVRGYSLYAFGGDSGAGGLYLCFLDSNTIAFGQRNQLEKLIAVRYGDEQNLLSNSELAPLISQANGSSWVWAVLSAPYARLALQQLAPQAAEFAQAQQVISKLRELTIEINPGSGLQAHFEALCASPDDANTFAALLQAGLLYQRYQAANSNPDLASMLDQAKVAPSGDRLDVTLSLTDDQMMGLIERNTFATHL